MTNPPANSGASRLEMWGGVECTVVRVGDEYRDQSVETGHSYRKNDIDLIADLGVTTVRYPMLWESIAPDRPDELDFAWTDERLAMLRKRGIEVIGGLLHHGSGPLYTELLDPDFPGKARRLSGTRCGSLSMDQDVDAGERAADDGAFLGSLRPLVPA
jgi:dTDP-4-dehydrorhamnose reductase